MTFWLDVAVATPVHSQVGGLLVYRSNEALALGSLVRVPLGKREVLGVVWGVHNKATDGGTHYLGEYLEVVAVRDKQRPQ